MTDGLKSDHIDRRLRKVPAPDPVNRPSIAHLKDLSLLEDDEPIFDGPAVVGLLVDDWVKLLNDAIELGGIFECCFDAEHVVPTPVALVADVVKKPLTPLGLVKAGLVIP